MKDLLEQVTTLTAQLKELPPPPADGRWRDLEEHYDVAYRLATAVNKLKDAADSRKRWAKRVVIQRLEDEELEGAPPVVIDGQRVVFSKYEFHAGNVSDREAFAEWARQEDGEAYFDPEPKLRQELVNALVKQRLDDKEPLPPGLEVYSETRLSRQAKPAAD